MLLFHLFASSEGLGFVPIRSKKILAAFHMSLKKQGWLEFQISHVNCNTRWIACFVCIEQVSFTTDMLSHFVV